MEDGEIREMVSRAEAIARDVDEPYRTAAFQVVLEWLLRGGGPARERTEPPVTERQLPGTVSEFLALGAPQSPHPETAVFVAYYQSRSGDPAGITAEELLAAYSQAKRSKPANVSDVLANAIRKGHLAQSAEKKNGKKCWVITQTGVAYVEGRLEQRRTGR